MFLGFCAEDQAGETFVSDMKHCSDRYHQNLVDLARRTPAYQTLERFMERQHGCDFLPAKISFVSFHEHSEPEFKDIAEEDLLENVKPIPSSRLFVMTAFVAVEQGCVYCLLLMRVAALQPAYFAVHSCLKSCA